MYNGNLKKDTKPQPKIILIGEEKYRRFNVKDMLLLLLMMIMISIMITL